MTKKLIIVGVDNSNSELLLASLKEKYGNDILVVTPEQAKEGRMKMEDFDNMSKYKIINPPIIPIKQTYFKSGKELRRERRNRQRKGIK